MAKNRESIIKTFNGGSWIRNSRMTSFEDCDIVVMPGGGDISAALYGHRGIRHSSFCKESDDKQMALIKKAQRLKLIHFRHLLILILSRHHLQPFYLFPIEVTQVALCIFLRARILH